MQAMRLAWAADHRARWACPIARRCPAERRVGAALRRSATASSGAGSSATPRIWTWCSCTTRSASSRRRSGAPVVDNQVFFLRLRAAPGAHADRALRRRAASMKSTCACGPAARAACWSPASMPSREYQTQRGLDLGAPGAAACPRRGRRLGLRARSRSAALERTGSATCGASDAARARCATCASACAASCRPARQGQFDLKQDPGGMADIEFLAQYWALRWAAALSAGGDVLRHHPAARVGGLGGPGAAGDHGHARSTAYQRLPDRGPSPGDSMACTTVLAAGEFRAERRGRWPRSGRLRCRTGRAYNDQP